MPVQIYVDDSGGQGQPSPAVLAGVLASTDEWIGFADDWRAALTADPPIRRFKMGEAAGRNGAFGGMSEEQRDGKLAHLAAVIRHHQPMSVFRATIDLDAFARTVAPLTTPPLSHPYFHLFYAMVWRVATQLALCNHTERFAIVFDEHPIYESRVRLWYPVFLDHIERLAGREGSSSIWARTRRLLPAEPVFRSDDAVMPLQCADLLAWLLRSECMGNRRFAWLLAQMPPVAGAADLTATYWRTLIAAPYGEVVREVIDPDRYGALLGLDSPPQSLHRVLRQRARAFREAHAGIQLSSVGEVEAPPQQPA